MATKDLTFSSKIKILGGHVVQLTSPNHCLPAGTDVTNTLKYFTNTLINILKEAPGIDGERFYGAKYAKSSLRITLFPTLSYSNLYRVVCDLLPVVHLVTTNQQALMETLLHLISCLTPFLTWEELMEFPYHVALMIPTTDPAYYSSIIRILCVYLLPNALESLLPLRDHLYRDLFTVISYGPPNTKMPAATLLFHYWPQLQSLLGRYKHIKPAYVVKPWEVPLCQRLRCINKISRSLASKMCTHPNMCAGECGLPPPAFICVDCFDTFVMRQYDDYFTNIVLPAAAVSVSCGNKACTSADKKAVAVCASHECVKHNRFRPVSLCQSCDGSRHPGNCGFVQTSIPNIWTMDHEIRSYVVDAIVNLLREAEPARKSSTIDTALQPIMDHTMERFMVVKDSLNSRYGILLIKELCEPKGNLVTESLGRLMGMLFHWFQCTGSTNRPETTETLEKLKTEHMVNWVQEVKRHSYEVILATLLPHPPDFAKVGGQWERLSSRTDQVKEGLQKLIMLGPYDIVSFEVWDYIMPYWIESIRTELSLKERETIKSLLKRTFDMDMSPLPFLADKIYHFLFARFESVDPYIQEQGLQWLQILTSVDVAVPFITILKAFMNGTEILINSTEQQVPADSRSDLEVKLNCFILMLDIILAQRILAKMPAHIAASQTKSAQIYELIANMISCVRPIVHSSKCGSREDDCDVCKRLTVFYQLIFDLLVHICPRAASPLPHVGIDEFTATYNTRSSPPAVTSPTAATSPTGDHGLTNQKEEAAPAKPLPPLHSLYVSLIQVLETDKDIDICYHVLSSLKILFVHARSMNVAYETHSQQVEEFLKQQCLPRLWHILDSRQSRNSKIAALLLFHSLALGDGSKYLWSIVEGDCRHSNWKVRYAAVDRIRMIWESGSTSLLSNNMLVLTALSHVYSEYIDLLYDPNHNVSQRARSYLKLFGEDSLQVVIVCMTAEFDTVIHDRHVVLHKLSLLQNSMPERTVFTWNFFFDRLHQLAAEAKLVDRNTDASFTLESMLSICGDSEDVDLVRKKAHFAISKIDHVRSIRDHSGAHRKSHFVSADPSMHTSKERKVSSLPLLKNRLKKKGISETSIQDWLNMAQGGLHELSHLHHMLSRSRKDETTPETKCISGKRIRVFWKAMENDRLVDHSLLHLLVEIIIKHLSIPVNKEVSSDEQYANYQKWTIEYMFCYLGYAEGQLFVRPSQLQMSPVLDALLCNLPQFLDANVEVGTKLLVDCLNILKFCGLPPGYVCSGIGADYTLAFVPSHLTKHWVQSLLIILYKYNYCNNSELSPLLLFLVQVVINTLSSIPHCCQSKARHNDSSSELQGLIQGTGGKDHSPSSFDEQETQFGVRSSPPELHKQKNLPGGASSSFHEDDRAEGSKLSSPDQSDAATRPSQSPLLMLKKNKNKNRKLSRQGNVDHGSPAKPDRKLYHWKAVDSSKGEDIAMVSMGSQQKSSPPLGASDKPPSHGEASKFTSNSQRKYSSVDGEGKREADNGSKTKKAHTPSGKKGPALGQIQQNSSSTSITSMFKAPSCPECKGPIDSYSEETIVLCIVAVETYLHHDLQQAASLVYDMLRSVSKVASFQIYSWQNTVRPVFIPGNVRSSALQFLRCSLHHLNPYNIMSALLLSAEDSEMFSTIVTALTDFPELNSLQALLTALEGINEKTQIKKVLQLIENLDVYLSSLNADLANSQEWPKIVDQLEILFRKLTAFLPEKMTNLTSVLDLMMSIFKLPLVTTHKGDRLVEMFGKFISVALQSHTFDMIPLAKLCQTCHHTFTKDRDRTILARVLVNELVLVLKYKSTLPEANVLTILEIVCLDCSSTLLPTYITNEIPNQLTSDMIIESGILEVMRLYLSDAVEFICDLHTLQKLKVHMKCTCLHEDTFGGLLKTGIAQIIALEMSNMIQSDPKAAQRIIPWLYTQQNFPQRGPKEFLESIDHVRFLCWLYIGALTHHAVAENVFKTKCQPLPLEDVSNISIMATSIMTGFVEYSTSSVAFMSSLFYGFILCQVWTVYCETLTFDYVGSGPGNDMDITQIIYNFWSIVSPTILNMVSHSKVLREMITLHVLSMMETLQECQSSVVVKLSPLWRQLLFTHDTKLPINILVRIQSLDNWQPSKKKTVNKAILLDWIKKTQFRLAQIEIQSSRAVNFVTI